MILLSVGTQLPFDRLVRAVDEWADRHGRADVVAQIGPSDYRPRRIRCFQFLNPTQFRELQEAADVMIAHAGMGSILTAMEFGKPIIVMPRDESRGEHRNGHQRATARQFRGKAGVYVAMDESELGACLDGVGTLIAASSVADKAPDAFTRQLRTFIDQEARRPTGLRRLLRGAGAQS